MIKIKCCNHGKVHLKKQFAFLSPRITATLKWNRTNTVRVPFPTQIMSSVVRYMKMHAKADATVTNLESAVEELDLLNFEYELFAGKDLHHLFKHAESVVYEADLKKQGATDGASGSAPSITEQIADAGKNVEGAVSSLVAAAVEKNIKGPTGSSTVEPVPDEDALTAEELRAFDDTFVDVELRTLLELNKAAHYFKIKGMMELISRAMLLKQ